MSRDPWAEERDVPSSEQHADGLGADLKDGTEAEDGDGKEERLAAAKGITSRSCQQGTEGGAGAEDGDDD